MNMQSTNSDLVDYDMESATNQGTAADLDPFDDHIAAQEFLGEEPQFARHLTQLSESYMQSELTLEDSIVALVDNPSDYGERFDMIKLFKFLGWTFRNLYSKLQKSQTSKANEANHAKYMRKKLAHTFVRRLIIKVIESDTNFEQTFNGLSQRGLDEQAEYFIQKLRGLQFPVDRWRIKEWVHLMFLRDRRNRDYSESKAAACCCYLVTNVDKDDLNVRNIGKKVDEMLKRAVNEHTGSKSRNRSLKISSSSSSSTNAVAASSSSSSTNAVAASSSSSSTNAVAASSSSSSTNAVAAPSSSSSSTNAVAAPSSSSSSANAVAASSSSSSSSANAVAAPSSSSSSANAAGYTSTDEDGEDEDDEESEEREESEESERSYALPLGKKRKVKHTQRYKLFLGQGKGKAGKGKRKGKGKPKGKGKGVKAVKNSASSSSANLDPESELSDSDSTTEQAEVYIEEVTITVDRKLYKKLKSYQQRGCPKSEIELNSFWKLFTKLSLK